HAPRPGGSPAKLRRLRRGHQPRSLVPRPHCHPHPRFRGGQQNRLVRGQLPDLRGTAPPAPGCGSRPAAPDPVPEAAPVMNFGLWISDCGLQSAIRNPKSAILMMELLDVTKTYQQGRRSVQALAGVNLRIAAGEFVTIIGPSGSGKSTLM